jgi:hypothetical protein
MVLVLVLVLILATSPFYAAAGLGLPCITRSFVRPFGSVQLLDTEHVIGDVEFRIDCLRHRFRKLFLSSSTVVSISGSRGLDLESFLVLCWGSWGGKLPATIQRHESRRIV